MRRRPQHIHGPCDDGDWRCTLCYACPIGILQVRRYPVWCRSPLLTSLVRLCRIVSMILRDIYSIRSLSSSDRCAFAARYSQDLRNWRQETCSFLGPDDINSSLLIPIFQRQRNVLNLAYWHTIILTHRPFLLSTFARLHYNSGSKRDNQYDSQSENSVGECLQAALSIANTVNKLVDTGQMFQAYWASVTAVPNHGLLLMR